MLALLGDTPDDAAAGADAVLRIETRLAQASRTPTALRDAEANYNKKTIPQLAALAPGLHWENYFKVIGAKDVSDVIVGQPEFFESVEGTCGQVRSRRRLADVFAVAPGQRIGQLSQPCLRTRALPVL